MELRVKARKLQTWHAEDGVAQTAATPVPSEEEEEAIRLVPYAAAKLRIAAFPQLKSGLPAAARLQLSGTIMPRCSAALTASARSLT